MIRPVTVKYPIHLSFSEASLSAQLIFQCMLGCSLDLWLRLATFSLHKHFYIKHQNKESKGRGKVSHLQYEECFPSQHRYLRNAFIRHSYKT
ncbi:hypothetical protein CY34DRAFT_188518 [Suillus luteus UH-Slu-Lm8-n1]|uniref:Uncharacterized protein n=1 Tax=Suillus luteus UH-Slu-Lm8-n1 TaxID=930992 RepID=A0A0D0B5D1_9AGAM|nr:hypothetical protein CY34DRAFT_188518 [Suillus luteus UH-Slu-Lm8-n1]